LLNGSTQAVKQHSLDGLSGSTVDASTEEQRTQAYLNSRRGQSNSDEDDLTPAQSRRKAQNRAAQRAFRERKERHVKDLEQRLASLEESQQLAVAENERLKHDLQKMSTENEILRATSGLQGGSNSLSPEPTTTGPMHYNPTDFYSNVLSGHANKTPSHRIVTSDDGERLLAAGATWDLIISHDLYKRGLVDIGDVSERLKNQARCDGQGPVFSERAIIEAIENSVASGSDELI
jgi:AP-1-like factor